MNGFQRLAATAALAACLGLSFAQSAAAKLNVVASFSIIADLARHVGGDRIALRTLVGPDGDAHVFEPRPSDAVTVANADLVLVNGLQFEGFLTRLIDASGTSAPVVEVSQGIEVIRDPAGGHFHFYGGKAVFHAAPFDPHAWQSIANARIYVRNIARALCASDREGCDIYSANADSYQARLASLEDEIRAAMDRIPTEKRIAVVGHNAFRYFEQAYGLTFLSPKGTSTEAEASAADVGGILDEIRKRHITAIFAENIADARLVRQIAAEAGLSVSGVLYSDALSTPDGPAPSYIDMMRHNASTILKATSPE